MLMVLHGFTQGPFIPVAPNGERPSAAWTFVPNAGQVFDLDGTYRPDVGFVSVGTFPTIYALKESRVAVTIPEVDPQDSSNNKVYRFDMDFVGTGALRAAPALYEPRTHRYNFYEANCPNGVTDVTGGARLIYANIYEGIDLHISSDRWGPKFYIVMNPGANPEVLKLAFSGLDSLKVDLEGFLKLYFDTKLIKLDQALAYQQDGQNLVELPWIANYELSGDDIHVGLGVSEYDEELPLIFVLQPHVPSDLLMGGGGNPLPPEWCTYLGGGGDDAINALSHDDEGYLYFTGRSSSTSGLPIIPGVFQNALAGQTDIILGRINRYYEAETVDQSTWTTYMGGTTGDEGIALEYDRVNERLVLGGKLSAYVAEFQNIPFAGNPACYQRTWGGFLNCFVAFWDPITGYPIYLSRFPGQIVLTGGGGMDVAVDAQGNTYVLSAGFIEFQNEAWFNPSGSYSDFEMSDNSFIASDCFIMQLGPDATKLWCTLLGGPRPEYAAACVVDDQNGLLHVVGHTQTPNDPATTDACSPSVTSTEFPLCGNSVQYLQKGLNSNNSQGQFVYADGFISTFKLDQRTLVSSTYFGGQGEDHPLDAVLGTNGELYIVGMSTSAIYSAQSCTTPDGAPGFPHCDAGYYYNGTVDGRKHFIARFNAQQQLTWCTRIGENMQPFFEDSQVRVTRDENGNIIVFGTTVYSNSVSLEPVPPYVLSGAYNNGQHSDAGGNQPRADCYVAMFNSSTQQLYGTYFGGVGNEMAGAVEAFDSRIYIGGSVYAGFNFPTHAPQLSGHVPYLDDVPNAQLEVPDGFLAQLRHDLTIGVPETRGSDHTTVAVFPNPTTGLLTFTLPEFLSGVEVELFDASGRSVLVRSYSRTMVCELDIRGLANGTYHALVRAGEQHWDLRVLKLN